MAFVGARVHTSVRMCFSPVFKSTGHPPAVITDVHDDVKLVVLAAEEHAQLRVVDDEGHSVRPERVVKQHGNVSVADGLEYYANIGPPYIMTLNDAKRFVDDYCHLCVVSRSVMPVWMTEMFAFSVAAANNNIKYTGLTNLGISSPGYQWGNHEYWTFVDSSMANPCEDSLAFVMPQDPPYAVHTCQYIGNFYKGKFPDTIANCDSPLFKLLPTTEWSAIETDVEEYLRPLRRQEVWAKCTLIKITNRALTELKQRTCPDGFNTFRGIDAIDTKRRAQSMDMSPWTPRGPQH